MINSEKKLDHIAIRFTEKDKKNLSRKADKLGLSLSAYIISIIDTSNDKIAIRDILQSITKIHSLLNKFKFRLYSRKDFINEMEMEVNKIWQYLK
jgi:hypothetical protein